MLCDIAHREAIRLPPPDQVKRLGGYAVQPDPDLPQLAIARTLKRRVGKIAHPVVAMQLAMPAFERGGFSADGGLFPRSAQPLLHKIARSGSDGIHLLQRVAAHFEMANRLMTRPVAGS